MFHQTLSSLLFDHEVVNNVCNNFSLCDFFTGRSEKAVWVRVQRMGLGVWKRDYCSTLYCCVEERRTSRWYLSQERQMDFGWKRLRSTNALCLSRYSNRYRWGKILLVKKNSQRRTFFLNRNKTWPRTSMCRSSNIFSGRDARWILETMLRKCQVFCST